MQSAMFRLSRSTSSGSFLPEIDGFRFVAIYLVVLHHSHYFLRAAMPVRDEVGLIGNFYQIVGAAGGVGVPIFFVVSGFILGLPFAAHHIAGQKRVDVRAYFLRRLRRIEPPYLINLTLIMAWIAWADGWNAMSDLTDNFVASALYLHNYIFNSQSQVNLVAWSLEIEAQFYLLAPLVALVFAVPAARSRQGVIVAGMVATCLFNYWMSDGPYRLLFSILALGQFFLAGYLLVEMRLAGRLEPAALPLVSDVLAGLCLVAAIFFQVGLPTDAMRSVLVVPVFGFFYFAFRGSLLLRVLRLPVVYVVGGMCYTIYLYHFWVLAALAELLDLDAYRANMPTIVLLDVAFFVVAVVVSVIPFLIFEKPFMARPPRNGRRAAPITKRA